MWMHSSPSVWGIFAAPQLDGMEIALKGGQLGEINIFGSIVKGKQEQP